MARGEAGRAVRLRLEPLFKTVFGERQRAQEVGPVPLPELAVGRIARPVEARDEVRAEGAVLE